MLRERWDLLAVLGLYVLVTLATAWLVTDACDGRLVFGLDDPYIHMSIARNIVDHGVFGIHPAEESAAASSFLWPWLLAGLFSIVGMYDSIPFFLSAVAGLLVVWQSWRLLRLMEISARQRALVLPPIFLLTPLLPMVFTGMEVLLHAWATLVVLEIVLRLDTASSWKLHATLMFSVMLAMLFRYETMFLVAGIAVVSILRKRYAVVGSSILGVLLALTVSGILYYGINGSVFPDSVLLKEHSGRISGLGYLIGALNDAFFFSKDDFILRRLGAMLILVAAATLALRRWCSEDTGLQNMLLVLGIAVIAQSVKVQHLYPWATRYEIHLMLPGLLFLAVAVLRLWKVRTPYSASWYRSPAILLGSFVLLLFTLNILYWGPHYTKRTVDASKNINDQQIQMARFVRAYYNDDAILLNDIGAVSYFTDSRIIDLVGLASPEISVLRQKEAFTNEYLTDLTDRQGAEIAIVYDGWFTEEKELPDDWILAGKWRIAGNFIAGWWEVSFYAVREAYHPRLVQALRAFSPQLPVDVMEFGDYVDAR